MRKLLLKLAVLILGLPILLVLAVETPAQSKTVSFQRGVELFQAADYPAALDELKHAAEQSPSNVPVQLWLGLAYTALDNEDKAQNIWRAGIGDEKWESVTWALKGLAFWKQNQKNNAIYYFKQADKSKPGYQICQQLLAAINQDADMPPLADWARITGLSRSVMPVPASTIRPPAPREELAPPDERQSQPIGKKPQGGMWRGSITNQKGDQTITFRVSADGGTISDIAFVGYWRCPSATNPTQSTRNAPPESVAVSGGAFTSTQNDRPSRMWYQFAGEFTGAVTASGTIRIAYAGGECDTFKLQWTAQRVGQ